VVYYVCVSVELNANRAEILNYVRLPREKKEQWNVWSSGTRVSDSDETKASEQMKDNLAV